MKGELALISLDQTADSKFCFYWNPSLLHGMRCDRVNPVEPIRKHSPSIVSDVKVLAENMIRSQAAQRVSIFNAGRGSILRRLRSRSRTAATR